MLNAKGRRCDVCARSPLLFFIFILSDVLARFKVIVMNYFGYQVELYKHIRKKQIFLIKIMFLHSKIALQYQELIRGEFHRQKDVKQTDSLPQCQVMNWCQIIYLEAIRAIQYNK